ncbi:hypothetical protein [Senegalia massiliensis]|uniref:Uncharacterized protein n=1 Tax=Senegalia massiliensis TaxID=1720316 RepID=A0A845QW97_9CLOT|nr:hypothetical protein [Senegalia massiliensis]NBI06264.1 hypothetical protein [Senegalia massiliensis]
MEKDKKYDYPRTPKKPYKPDRLPIEDKPMRPCPPPHMPNPEMRPCPRPMPKPMPMPRPMPNMPMNMDPVKMKLCYCIMECIEEVLGDRMNNNCGPMYPMCPYPMMPDMEDCMEDWDDYEGYNGMYPMY